MVWLLQAKISKKRDKKWRFFYVFDFLTMKTKLFVNNMFREILAQQLQTIARTLLLETNQNFKQFTKYEQKKILKFLRNIKSEEKLQFKIGMLDFHRRHRVQWTFLLSTIPRIRNANGPLRFFSLNTNRPTLVFKYSYRTF